MNRDQKTLYLASSLLAAVLLAVFFLTSLESKIVCACLLVPSAFIIRRLIRKRRSYALGSRMVFALSLIFAVFFTACILMSRFHFGSIENPYFKEPNRLLTSVLPLIALIVSSEVIRATYLAQNNRFATVLAYITSVLTEVLAYSGLAGITSMNRFMDLIGLTLFPALSANIYYQYVSRRYGMAPNIAFRLITTLYIYFVPTATLMSDALLAVIKMFTPLLLLFLTMALFDKGMKKAKKKGAGIAYAATALVAVLVLSVILLVSGQFRYGTLVIATGSMTGEINRGDMIIYERYEDQPIKEGQVIVFIDREVRIVHRVIRIENIAGEFRYYTKGDANDAPDQGYRTEADIVGLTDTRLAYLGFPTLWLNEMISGSHP